MVDFKSALLGVLEDVENVYDEARQRLRQRLGIGKVQIVPYMGHGTTSTFYLKGRVLRDKGIGTAMDEDTLWTNLVNMYKRYESDEIPDARVRVRFGDRVEEVLTDEEGFYMLDLSVSGLPPSKDNWYEVEFTLVDYPGEPGEAQDVKAIGRVLVAPPDAQFGVISDIDDTVLRTDVLDIIAMARNTFLMNSRTRLPFEGVAAFYQALQKGTTGKITNPIFYVSSSAWNLYDMLADFFTVRGIPAGPLFLTNLGLSATQLITPSHHDHKIKMIQSILDAQPKLPFVLVGDNTQKDPEIYYEIVKANPGRIKVVYIRDLAPEARDAIVETIDAEMFKMGVEMLPVKDTVAAAVDASTRGLIDPEALPAISEETAEDKQAPTPLEQALKPSEAPAPAAKPVSEAEKAQPDNAARTNERSNTDGQ